MTNCKLGKLKNTMNGGRSKRATRRLQKKRSVKPKKIRGGKRSVRARAGKKTRRNKAKRARKQRGGAQYLLEGDFSLSQAWNGFLYKKLFKSEGVDNAKVEDIILFDQGTTEESKLPGGDREKKVLYIIDMQYDFMDEEFLHKESDGDKDKKIGSFAVAEGKDLVVAEKGFLKWLVDNAPNFDKIYVSRDFHTEKHMSFMEFNGNKENIRGNYPPHCVQGTKGAMLHENLITTLTNLYKGEIEKIPQDLDAKVHTSKINEKYKVLFKGINDDNESYSALAYDLEEKYTQYHAKSDNQTTEVKGGYVHSSMTFDNALKYNENIANTDDFNVHELDEFYDNEEPIPASYYVCGLAGDFCVRDTAYAIGNTKKNENSQVYVLGDYTRYVFVPIVWKLNSYNKITTTIEETKFNQLKNNDSDHTRSINQYIFDSSKQNQIVSGNTYTTIITNATNKVRENDNIRNHIEDKFKHFITNHQDIIADYKEAGVKIILSRQCGKSKKGDVYENIDDKDKNATFKAMMSADAHENEFQTQATN